MLDRLRQVATRLVSALMAPLELAPAYVRTVKLWDDPEIEEWARLAYHGMVEWFGEPPDPDIPIVAHYAPGMAYEKVQWHGRTRYAVSIPVEDANTDLAFVLLAFLVCRRVIQAKSGIVREPWVQQVVEVCAGHQCAIRTGHAHEARHAGAPPTQGASLPVPVRGMKLWPGPARGRFRVLLRGKRTQMQRAIHLLALHVEDRLGWEAIRAMAFAQTWDEWLAGLAPEVRERAVKLLELEPGGETEEESG